MHPRLLELDVFRGWAIVLMLIYHFVYDLNHFSLIEIHMNSEPFWVYARTVIVTMFLLSVGISLALAHSPNPQWYIMKKRTLLLGGACILVSLATYIQFPHTWIYFGILHFIFIASWLGLLLLPYPLLSLCVMFVIFIGSAMGVLHTQGLFAMMQKPLDLPAQHTEDLVRFFPWFAVVLMGMVLVSYNVHTKLLKNMFLKTNIWNRKIAFLGQNALVIYLVHQPIFFGIFYLFV